MAFNITSLDLNGVSSGLSGFGQSNSSKTFGGKVLSAAGSAGFESVKDGKSNVAASAVNAGLDVAASAIPFGSVVKDVLDKLGLQENINLVTKYGLSSWGASTSPEQIKANFAKTVKPYIEQKMALIEQGNGANLAEVLNEIEDILLANHYFHIALRDYHSNAKSTRLAHDWAQKELERIRSTFVTAVKSAFGKHGVKFTRVRSNEHPRDLNVYNLEDGNKFKGRDLNRYTAKQYYNWKVDFSNVKVNEQGKISDSSGSSFLVKGGIAYGLFKLFT